jgi:hypothetical protein
MNDLKVVLRRLIKHPRFAAVAVLLLVFGAATFGNSCAACAAQTLISRSTFDGLKAGDEIVVSVVRLCWCPPGKFIMGSPRNEPEWRPDEDQVEVTLTKGFWMGKFEATQGQWKQVMGKLPGPLTTQLPEGDDFPVGNVNFAEAEAFCQRLTEIGHQSGELPNDWQFRLPTEAQWEYACRAGTTTATAFGDKLNSKQANFKGQPYNGAESGPSLGRAAKVGSYPANAWGCMICTVISSNGAAIGITPNSPAGLIRICISQRLRPACAEAVAGPMTVGPVDRLSGCGLNRNVATTTSASESQPSNENKQVPLSS